MPAQIQPAPAPYRGGPAGRGFYTRWTGINEMFDQIDLVKNESFLALSGAATLWAKETEAEMKTGAKWTDQTGRARRELYAQVFVTQGRIDIEVGSPVEYQIYLETRWGGKFAIIVPTIDRRLVDLHEELILAVESAFELSESNRLHQAITGRSMGGLGAGR